MKRLVTILWAMLVVPFAASAAGTAALAVKDAWISEAPPGVQSLAGYFVIENHGTKPVVLTGGSSPTFGRVMVHRTMTEQGMASMQHLDRLEIPAGGKIVFEPTTYHLMLMMPTKPLKAGDKVEIRLSFEGGPQLPVTFTVRRADGMGGMDHMSHAGHH